MGLILGIVIAIVTVPVAFAALMTDSNWETGEGGSPRGALGVLIAGWLIAAALIVSHFHPVHLGW